MKKVIEQAVPKDVDILDYISELAKNNLSWIFISRELCHRLEAIYSSIEYENGDGQAFCIDTSSSPKPVLYVGEQTSIDKWLVVSAFSIESDACIANDPEIIYFLS